MNTAEQISALMEEAGASNAQEAVRLKARELIDQYCSSFGEPLMPFDMDTLASFRGIVRSEEAPLHSSDAELVPMEDGSMTMRLNPDQPETRKRFSVAHEISHTFFPEYDLKIQCRSEARRRNLNDPEQQLEDLCDTGASELLFPYKWFIEDINGTQNVQHLLEVIIKYQASREATLRRFAEIHPRSLATVFFSWKLKPTEIRTTGQTNQINLFGSDPEEEARLSRMLRVDYTISSALFTEEGHFLPKDKSIDSTGPIYEASSNGTCTEGEVGLNLGGCRGIFHIMAIPLYTEEQERGPNGEMAVATIIEPLDVKARKKIVQLGPTLFD